MQQIDLYSGQLDRHGITDKDIRELKFQQSFVRVISYILGLPFFIPGVIFNFIPYYLVQYILKKSASMKNFQGSMILAAGLILFTFFYITVSVLTGIFTPIGWWAVLLPLVMYITGFTVRCISAQFNMPVSAKICALFSARTKS
ncbi:MAG: hypothetical protein IPM77_10305 [Crocinitomicaceae bacterium]|nr:hypothetical protein [Crocinitomicaceae bacterium]